MQEMVLYFCHFRSKDCIHDRLEKFKLGEEPDYFNWLIKTRNDFEAVIINHNITYYKTKIDNFNLENNEKNNKLRIGFCEHTQTKVVQEKFGEEWICIHEDTREQELENINKLKQIKL